MHKQQSEQPNTQTIVAESLMKDRHGKIIGYRELSEEEIDLMNESKALAEQCGAFIDKLTAIESIDKRCVSLGKTNLQQGFMWTIRSIAQPTTF
jgi:hypothetical protein